MSFNDFMNALANKSKRPRYKKALYKGKRMSKHRIAATKALGHPLPPGAIVHHVDGNRFNYRNYNLVVCPDKEYHQLLHQRTKALGYFARPS